MTINDVAGLLGYSKERVESLISEGVALPKSGAKIKLGTSQVGSNLDISDSQFDEFVGAFEAEEPGRWPPAAVRRQLLVEARHRCAICQYTAPPQFHHMLDWAKVKHHDPCHMLVLCGTCHSLCTNGFIDYKAQVAYKTRLRDGVGSSHPHSQTPKYRKIEDAEQRQWLTIGERVALRKMEEEFGCEVRTNVRVTAGEGWLNLDAAVVRNEDIVAIEIYEYKGDGFPYFQIEHLIQVGSQMKFDRFQKFVFFIVVVSNANPQLDNEVEAELKKLSDPAPCEVQIRMLRLNPLRANYSL